MMSTTEFGNLGALQLNPASEPVARCGSSWPRILPLQMPTPDL